MDIEFDNHDYQRLKLEASSKTIPRFLFRAFSPTSAGTNNSAYIAPGADPGPLSLSTEIVLRRHLSWDTLVPTEFVSWTDSILLALVHAIRKVEGQVRNDPGDHVFLAILDTSTVFDRTPIYPAGKLLDFFGVPDTGYWDRKKFVHEFLAHGCIINFSVFNPQRFSVVNVLELLNNGLYTVFPPFQFPDRRVWKRVEEVRQRFQEPEHAFLSGDMARIKAMADCFSADFRIPMTLAFMTMVSYPPSSYLKLMQVIHPRDFELSPTLRFGESNEAERLRSLLDSIDFVKRIEKSPALWNDLPDLSYGFNDYRIVIQESRKIGRFRLSILEQYRPSSDEIDRAKLRARENMCSTLRDITLALRLAALDMAFDKTRSNTRE